MKSEKKMLFEIEVDGGNKTDLCPVKFRFDIYRNGKERNLIYCMFI